MSIHFLCFFAECARKKHQHAILSAVNKQVCVQFYISCVINDHCSNEISSFQWIVNDLETYSCSYVVLFVYNKIGMR